MIWGYPLFLETPELVKPGYKVTGVFFKFPLPSRWILKIFKLGFVIALVASVETQDFCVVSKRVDMKFKNGGEGWMIGQD